MDPVQLRPDKQVLNPRHSYSKLEGWLAKQGATKFSAEKTRWFTLDHGRRVLYYYKKPGLPHTSCIGFIDIMLATAIEPTNERPWEFQITTPGRVFFLTAASDVDFVKWVNGLTYFHHTLIEGLRSQQLASQSEATAAPNSLRYGANGSHPPRSRLVFDGRGRGVTPSDSPERKAENRKRSNEQPPKTDNCETLNPVFDDRGALGRRTTIQDEDERAAVELEARVPSPRGSKYSNLLARQEALKSELAEAKRQIDIFREALSTTVKRLEEKHNQGRMTLKLARYEVWLARAQLGEIQKAQHLDKERQKAKLVAEVLAGVEASRGALEMELAKELNDHKRESTREKEKLERLWLKEADKWEAERQRMVEDRQREREEWERERREWIERVANLSGSQGDDEEDDYLL